LAQKKKIALVVYTLQSGGLERTVSNHSFLFRQMGFEVDLYVLDGIVEYPYSGHLFTFSLSKKLSLREKIKEYIRLRSLIRKGQYLCVLDHRYRLNSTMETIWYRYIYASQNLVYFVHSADISSYITPSLAKKNIRWISVSKGLEHILKQSYPKLSVQTIYNAVKIKTERSHSFPHEFVLAVGRMDDSGVKQLDVLIDCYAQSLLPQQHIHLYIVGSGVQKISLQEKAQQYPCRELIHFEGFQLDISNYYIQAKFLILSSKYEGLGMVLIESLLCGSPVISYDCPVGPSEIVSHEFNGLLVENQNQQALIEAMNRMILDGELYDFCKKNAACSVEKFSMKAIAQMWRVFFNDIH